MVHLSHNQKSTDTIFGGQKSFNWFRSQDLHSQCVLSSVAGRQHILEHSPWESWNLQNVVRVMKVWFFNMSLKSMHTKFLKACQAAAARACKAKPCQDALCCQATEPAQIDLTQGSDKGGSQLSLHWQLIGLAHTWVDLMQDSESEGASGV